MHHHNVRMCLVQPAGELVVGYDACCEVAAMALVRPVIREAAALCWESTDEMGVVDASFL